MAAPDADVEDVAQTDDIEPTELKPDFVVIRVARVHRIAPRILSAGILIVSAIRSSPRRFVLTLQLRNPPSLTYLVATNTAKRLQVETIGLQVRPIYRDHPWARYFLKCSEHFNEVLGGH